MSSTIDAHCADAPLSPTGCEPHLATSAAAPPIDETSAVRDAVFRLRDSRRELVMLVHWDGFTIVEAAELLGLNPSTARGRYAAARTALREALEDTVDEPQVRC